jgi:hypothetical protein
MTIILFHGLGSSKKQLNYIHQDNKYIKNDFVKQLQKLDNVYIPTIPYTNIYYYGQDKQMSKLYEPLDYLNYDDLMLDKYITKLYKMLEQSKYKAPYILMASSHGIYYACEFARQYKNMVKYIVSLDGSWITNKLNNNRLLSWRKKEKIIPKINNQKTLDNIIDKIKNEEDNSIYIKMIFDYVRGTHTKFVIKKNYEKLNVPFITFRDYETNPKGEFIEYNNNVLKENKILSKYNNHIIYILLDGSHIIWTNDNYKNTIIKTIEKL